MCVGSAYAPARNRSVSKPASSQTWMCLAAPVPPWQAMQPTSALR